MRRADDWEFRLVSYVRSQAGRPFRWGITDCYTLARSALCVIYDEPILPSVLYRRHAAATHAAKSFHDLPGALEVLGAACVGLTFAQAGDLLLLPGDDGWGLPRFGVMADGRGHVLTSGVAEGVTIVDAGTIPPGTTAWRWLA